VYAYLRSKDSPTAKAGTPYYIGKGKKDRAYSKHSHIKVPNNKKCIIILERNLSEIGAFALERRYIKWWGRKIDGTGVLRNMTYGGDGTSGRVVTEETRRKMSSSLIGRTPWNKGILGIKGTPCSESSKKKLSEAMTGKKLSEEHKKKLSDAMTGKVPSEETREKISEAMKKSLSSREPWNKGKLIGVRSEETRKRISEASKLREKRKKEERNDYQRDQSCR
jgi:hypothetical protein